MKNPLLSFILSVLLCYSVTAQEAVGEWQDYLPYQNLLHVVDVGDKVFAATGVSMFAYGKTSGAIERYNKVRGLSDVRITTLAYDEVNEILLVGYANGNIDLFDQGRIVNLSDIKRSDVIGDRAIYEATFIGSKAWLSTGFGIVVIDVLRKEVSDTYFIGPDAASIRVNSIGHFNDTVYAATEVGMRYAPIAANLPDFGVWQWDTTLTQTSGYDELRTIGGQLLALDLSSGRVIYKDQSAPWLPLDVPFDSEVKSMSRTDEHLVVTRRNRIVIRNSDLEVERTLNYFNTEETDEANAAVLAGQELFVADRRFGLVEIDTDGQVNSIVPEGPWSERSWSLETSPGRVWVAHGGASATWNILSINDQTSALIDRRWRVLKNSPGVENLRDHLHVLDDPLFDDKVYISSWNRGLASYDLEEDVVTELNEFTGGAPIEPSNQLASRIQSASAEFDSEGNLWVTNSYTVNPFKIRLANGEWISLGCQGVIGVNSLLEEMVLTESGVHWVVMPRGVGLLAFTTNGTTADPSDDDCRLLGVDPGEGNLPTTQVFSVAEDLDGEIWIGTNEGPAVNYSPSQFFSDNPLDFQQILIEQGENVEVLLGNEIITAIAIDGANRKWFGTQGSGAFLISEDGSSEILHFTAENSPLYNNEIRDIAIEPETGEVFFATDDGLLSYRGDATASSTENDCSSVFPNPVREGYTGVITIDGLVDDSDVKITDVAGNIVFQTRANGGRATWRGTDFDGSRVETGVYFAHSTSSDGETACTAKILLIK